MIARFAALLLQAVAPSATPLPGGKVVRVWLDANAFTRGASVRVSVQAAEDGNLIVLRRRTDGHIEVLFPNTPAADPAVRAGTYEIRGPNDRPGWPVREPDGTGMALPALPPHPPPADDFLPNPPRNPHPFLPTFSAPHRSP